MTTRRDFVAGASMTSALAITGVLHRDAWAISTPPQTTKQSSNAGGLADPFFNSPYLDVDEWRDEPMRHRYVHGGFKGTEVRFCFYFPPKDKYQNRFFQYIPPIPLSEMMAQERKGSEDMIGFTLQSGAYFVETNEGGFAAMGNPSITGFGANAAAATYSRDLAAQMYGAHRTYGYAFGGGGGAFKTISGFENTDAWDGAVPYVIGSPMTIPVFETVCRYGLRVLWNKFPSILDSIEPGGSGDTYAGLNEEEREALREVTRMGFPLAGWFNYQTLGQGGAGPLFNQVRVMDPTYFTHDFWTMPGYEGANPPESLLRARVQHKTAVKKVVKAGDSESATILGGADAGGKQPKSNGPMAFVLESVPGQSVDGAFLLWKSGAAAGSDTSIAKIVGKTAMINPNPSDQARSSVLHAIQPGDEVQIDNSDFLAYQTYHRHQLPSPDFYVWDQFRKPDGEPRYPQRPRLLGPLFNLGQANSLQSGRFKGKMIAVESLMDQDAFPWQADWYRSKVKASLGERLDDNFRLWFTEHALHLDNEKQEDPTRTVSYLGVVYQALRDLSAWVEKGSAPSASTEYKVVDGQVKVPATAKERHGIQPVVHLDVNGGKRAEVAVGQSVHLTARIELPPNTGKIVCTEWDFDGKGTFPLKQEIQSSQLNPTTNQLSLALSHAFSSPGTYYPTLRAISERDGNTNTPLARIQNLGRVRVVVK